MLEIIKVEKNSIADELGFEIGDKILSVNGREVYDFIDFTYLDGIEELFLTVQSKGGEIIELELEKDEFEPLGVTVKDNSKMKVCKNKCAFCFVDQLPDDMRESLYVKDDDWRYSLLCGNYVTLTNLSEYELERILEYKISPLYVSVHAYNAEIRQKLVKNPATQNLIDIMKKMGNAGIKMHTQIVMCKGINDGEILRESIEKLSEIEGVLSIAVVPVGLTKHRCGLFPLLPVDKTSASKAIDICESAKGKVDVYCSDEMYLRAEREIPNYEFYGDFSQIENGVGLIAKFKREFLSVLGDIEVLPKTYGVITGMSAKDVLNWASCEIEKKGAKVQVFPIKNDFFGDSVTVAGLVTGGDIINQLKGKDLPEILLVPQIMLKEFETVFLDGVTIEKLEKELGKTVRVIAPDGESFARAFTK